MTAQAPSPTLTATAGTASLLTLTDGELTLQLAPLIGGSIAAFYSLRDGQQHHWLRPASEQTLRTSSAEGMGSFPLVPFCNRIRNGHFTFEGREVVLPPNRGNSPHTIHGYGWQLPWRVIEHGATSARLELDYPGDVWPYRFRATQLYELKDGALAVTIGIENVSEAPMPFGLGHHPYVPHRPGTVLTTSVQSMWGGDQEVMPTGLEQPALIEQMRRGVLLADVEQDNNFIGWEHSARVDWPAAGGLPASSLTMEASAPLNYFVLYSPRGADHFCIEGVSNCTDWINLGEYAHEQIGGDVLAPGQASSAHFTLTPGWRTS